MLEAFGPEYAQRALVEIALLAAAAGLVGTWIVLRGLAFYAHAVGAAAFPGLVLADGLAFSPLLGAAGTAALVAGVVALLARRQPGAYDGLTAMTLVGALAAGVILASDVFGSQGSVDRLLFGSLLLVDRTDQLATAAVALVAAAATLVLGRRWLASGFDAAAARALGVRSGLPDLVLLALVAAATVCALDAIGALLAAALLVTPAATARLVVDRMGRWQLCTAALAAGEGAFGLWLSLRLNAPPGATIAVVGGVVFLAVAALRVAAGRLPAGALA